ncbi:hypothetical protein JTE90_011202 [Oedothorax gibbosus]|uniref:Uncharacterized protein n=1 Tax=Oedothorax gibbosus TaxID=931172 RepID=A0AAV6W0D1_9ARAC|nr:hypothetical protein JTE90_011202 [Oedothorax gibbosus]
MWIRSGIKPRDLPVTSPDSNVILSLRCFQAEGICSPLLEMQSLGESIQFRLLRKRTVFRTVLIHREEEETLLASGFQDFFSTYPLILVGDSQRKADKNVTKRIKKDLSLSLPS